MLLFATLLVCTVAEFDIAQANISVWFSTVTDCGWNNYTTHEYKGPIAGFVVTHAINDKKDTEGFVGYLPSDRSIYVAIRGTKSTRNLITDLRFLKTNYTAAPECNCEVHKGFFEAEQEVFPQVLKAVQKLQKQFPEYDVKVTGHSYGAAVINLIALDLIRNNVTLKHLYNFGQPRTGKNTYLLVDASLFFSYLHSFVGTKAFSDYTKSKMPNNYYRLTHSRDYVPHIPPTHVMGYYHVCTEIFEDENHNLKICDDSCEDPTCANHFDLKDLTATDHVFYLGLNMSCINV